MEFKRKPLRERLEQSRQEAGRLAAKSAMRHIAYMFVGYAAGYVVMMVVALILRG